MCNITNTKLIEQYDDVFKGLECLKDEYHIDIDNCSMFPEGYQWQ